MSCLSRTDNAREKRARRALAGNGSRLVKSRARNITGDDFGGYRIVDLHTNGVEAGSRFELDLDDVENFIAVGNDTYASLAEEKAAYEELKSRVYAKAKAQGLWPTYRDGLGWMLVDGGQQVCHQGPMETLETYLDDLCRAEPVS